MSNVFSHVKSVAIVLLAALCVYQTGLLWFVNITNRNFLLNFLPFLQAEELPEGFDKFVTPWRHVRANADGTFSTRFEGLTGSSAGRVRPADAVLVQLLADGSFVDVIPAEYENILPFLTYPAYTYSYAFPMDAEKFSLGFGQRGGVLAGQGLPPFKQVIVRMDGYVVFVCVYGNAYVFSVPLTDFEQNGEWENVYTAEGGLRISKPYAVDGQSVFALDHVRREVEGFFGNPAAIRSIVDSAVWVYRDATTIVRYYDSHVLEYISYRPVDRSAGVSFEVDFVAAVQFVERDRRVINDIYLADYREEGSRHVFYFGFLVGGLPLTSWGVGDMAGLAYPVTVTVDHGTVVRYRKLAVSFHVEGG